MRTKLTQMVDHFTVFKNFHNTSCCSQKFLPKKIKKFGYLDVQSSIRDFYSGWVVGDGMVGKGYNTKWW